MKKMKNRMKQTFHITSFLLLGMLAVSCLPTRSLVVDIPLQAQKELPSSIQSLTLVTQAVDDTYTNLHTDSLQKIFYEKRFNLDTVIHDVQMADTTLKALGELLFESGRYEYVIPEARFIKPSSNEKPAPELSWDYVNALTDTFQTDAVLSLDFLNTKVVTDFNNETYYRPYEENFYSSIYASIQIQYEAMFRVYDPQQKRVVLREIVQDTLFWEDGDVSVNALFNRFTPVKQALSETGIVIALELAESIAVKWRPERRRFFASGSSKLRQGNELALNGDWLGALELWQQTAQNSSSKSLKSKALLNIALGYEILGNVDEAIDWALKSYETMYRPLTYEYLETLRRRKIEITKSVK